MLLELLVQELGLLVVHGESLAHFGHVDQLFCVLEVNGRIFYYFGLHIVDQSFRVLTYVVQLS